MKVKIQVSITILLFCCQTLLCVAQSNLLKKANEFYNQFAFTKAIDLYKKVLIKEPTNVDALIKLANAYRLNGNTSKSIPAYKKAIQQAPTQHELKLHCAQAFMSKEQYKDALHWFSIYNEVVPNDSRNAFFIQSCQNINQYKNATPSYTLQKVTFNSSSTDFAPVFYKKGLVFTSIRNENTFEQKNEWTGKTYTDIYYTKTNNNNNWTRPTKLPGKANKPFHEGPATFNQQFTKMYFTRNARKKDKNGEIINLKIYESSWINNKWQQEVALPFNSDNYSIAHPSISKDGKTLYFTANMPNGFGGKDIYVSFLNNGQWTSPKNLGPSINSEGDEVFPFIHEDGTLYFSSNGKGGLGGLDVFQATKQGKAWQLKHMLTPVNSAKDDFSFIFDADNEIGYFSSNRKGGLGSDDIYKIKKNTARSAANSSVQHFAGVGVKTNFITPLPTAPNFPKNLIASAKVRVQDYHLALIGIVIDEQIKQPVPGELVTLTIDQTNQVDSIWTTEDGSFCFKLLPDKNYLLRKISPGGEVEILKNIATFNTLENILHVILEIPYSEKRMVDKKPQEAKFEQIKVKNYSKPVLPPNLTDRSYISGEENQLTFKIQIGAYTKAPDLQSDKFRNIGIIEQEVSKSRKITKYLAGNFDNYGEAKEYRDILELDGFKDAFVVSYLNGYRLEKPTKEILEIYRYE